MATLMSPPCSPFSTYNLSFSSVVLSAPLLHTKIFPYNNTNTHLHLPLSTHQTNYRGKIFVVLCSKQNYIDTHRSAISTQEVGNCSAVGLVVVNDRHHDRHRVNTIRVAKMAGAFRG